MHAPRLEQPTHNFGWRCRLHLFCSVTLATPAKSMPNYVGGSDYANPASWSPQVVPNNGNGGNAYRVTIGHAEDTSGPASNMDA